MDIGDYYWGLYEGYYRDPFPHSLLSTREEWAVGFMPCAPLLDCLLKGSGDLVSRVTSKVTVL